VIYFGEGNGIEAPVGELCIGCEEPFVAGDQGVIMPLVGDDWQDLARYHRECHIRSIMGSVGHQLRQCSCFGGTLDDPEGMTSRQAAQAAYTLFRQSQS
jgi:hypothetical protein